MIIYNETIILDEAIREEWLKWMKEIHIPAIMATGHFNSYQILNVLDSPNEGVTFCVQYHANTQDEFTQYYNTHLHRLQGIHQQQFENKFVLFNTLMETVD